MALIRKLLLSRGISDFDSVKNIFITEYGISVKESERYPSLYLLMYTIKTKWSDPVAYECRGIILEKETNKVVCYPFNKFFNHGEKYASDIDWKTASAQEKLDGSLLKLFYYTPIGEEGQWILSTNGTIDARNKSNRAKSFYDYFIEALPILSENVETNETNRNNKTVVENQTGSSSKAIYSNNKFYNDYDKLDKNNTYMFELIHPENIIVINYKCPPKLYHIGTRNNITFQEINIMNTSIYIRNQLIEKTKIFSFNSINDINDKPSVDHLQSSNEVLNYIKEFLITMSTTQEGFVVSDSSFNRIKIKSNSYVERHHLWKLENPLEQCINLYFKGEKSEVLVYFPDLINYFNRIEKFINHLIENIKSAHIILIKDIIHNKELSEKEKRKRYAIMAKELCSSNYHSILMSMYTSDENCDYFNSIRQIQRKKLIEIMIIYEEKGKGE